MTKEALKAAIKAMENSNSISYEMMHAIADCKEALAQDELCSSQEPRDIAALVEGMAVSIDVSTGDHDSGNRLFGAVTLVQQNQGSKHGLILLVQDPEPN